MNDTNEEINQQPQLRIWQQNMNGSLMAHDDLIQFLNPKTYELVLLQEPHIDFLGNSRANSHWHVLYPPQHRQAPKKTRSIILINRSIATGSWTQIQIQSCDVTAIEIRGNFGTLRVYNIYNDCKHNDSLTTVAAHIRDPMQQRIPSTPLWMIWAGDFNRHHPLWDEERNQHLFTTANLELTRPLLNMLARYDMKMVLPKDIPTLEACSTKNLTRVDNVFCSEGMLERFTQCGTRPDQRPQNTDHYPISATIDIRPEIKEYPSRPNFRDTDWEKFTETLAEKLRRMEEPREFEEGEKVAFEKARMELERAVKETMDEHVPMSKPTPYAKRWWSRELRKARAAKLKLERKSYNARRAGDATHHIHETARRACNDYSQMIKKAKAEHWADWLENLEELDVWVMSRMVGGMSTDGGRMRVPTLETCDPVTKTVIDRAESNEEKSRMFFKTFFPPKPATNINFDEAHYPPAKWKFQPITDEQIHRAIQRMKPYKATKAGTASNAIFTHARHILVPYLGPIYRAVDKLGIYPTQWKITETPVLRKPGKADYTAPGAY